MKTENCDFGNFVSKAQVVALKFCMQHVAKYHIEWQKELYFPTWCTSYYSNILRERKNSGHIYLNISILFCTGNCKNSNRCRSVTLDKKIIADSPLW